MNSLLEIKNLSTGFDTGNGFAEAIGNISFALHRGETLGLVGESGSGKSVTALSIMRLISAPGKIRGGEIIFHDSDRQLNLLSLPEKDMCRYRGNRIAMIFQEPMTSLNPLHTCGAQVAEAILVHQRVSKKEANEKTRALFEKVRLGDPDRIIHAYPHQLSGGQKQRVMIAMAISCNPDVLIADEPTTALDVTVQAAILELLRDLQKETGMSILFITHDLAVVSNLAQRIVVMYNGRIVEQGRLQDVFDNPQHPYTKGLLACRPPMNRRYHTLPVIRDFMKTGDDGAFQETGQDIEKLLLKYIVSDEVRKSDLEKLYSQQPLLEVKNLSAVFPGERRLFSENQDSVTAVDNVSFVVYPGETLGLVGESGCGKTTLGRSILRLTEPASGKVIFKGIDLATLEGKSLRQMRKHMQIIFQDPLSSLNPRMKTGDAILEPMQVHGLYDDRQTRKKKVLELLQRVGLKEQDYERYPHEFSGGQRQRICIARALAIHPQLIICDESVSALDVSVQAQVLNLLNELKKDYGFTTIFISHDLSVVKFMSDRIAVMNKGRIEELGDAEEVYRAPKTEYTKKLIAAIPRAMPATVA